MSTLKTNNISNVAGTATTDVLNVINGSAKAWVNFNGTGTVAIRQGYNVSSITDNGVGDYSVNFTNALADANYSPTMSAASVNMGIQPIVKSASTGGAATTKTTSALQIILQYAPTATNYDAAEVYVAVFR